MKIISKVMCVGILSFSCAIHASEQVILAALVSSSHPVIEQQPANSAQLKAEMQISNAGKKVCWPLCILTRTWENGCACWLPMQEEKGEKPSCVKGKWKGSFWQKQQRSSNLCGCSGSEVTEQQELINNGYCELETTHNTVFYKCCGLYQEGHKQVNTITSTTCCLCGICGCREWKKPASVRGEQWCCWIGCCCTGSSAMVCDTEG